MKTSGKLGQRTLLASVCITLLLLLIAGITNRMLVNQRDIGAAHERRYQSYLLADQLRQSSDDLTRLARTYVMTGDARFEEQYWTVLDIRNGKTPRPLHYERIYWDFMAVEGAGPRAQDRAVALQQLMKEQGFTEGEFAKLKEAQDNSDGLVQIETVAMNAVKGLFADGKGGYTRKGAPDLEMARQLMHGRDYHAEKARIMKPIDEFLAMLDQRTAGEVQVLEQHGHRLFQVLLATVGLSIITLFGLCFSIFRTVIAPIQRVMADLSVTSQELDAASAQLARSSHTLSSAASEQAASVEETSASLEELSSMIQATAGQAQDAKSLAAETRMDAEGGSRTMVEMVGAMAEIDASSAQVAKIVKDIDELAFQTNILALNAAVEAARAGEAGAGFAVVADEVRSLAQRSAAAARETADKIEAAMATSRKGSVSTTRVGESLRQILGRVAATDSVVAGMATAAREQALGIQQINQAIEQIDKASQLNASNAEETAAAAEQVDVQGEALNELVDRLRQLVGGATDPGTPGDSSDPAGRPRSTLVVHAGPENSPKARRAAEAKPRIGGPNPKELPSGTPGDDAEFRNF